jgi:hypothetical protein
MGNISRRQDGIPRFHLELLGAYFQQEIAFKGIKPFILILMEVFRGTTFFMESILDNKDAVAVFWRDLKGKLTNAEAAMFSELIFIRCNAKQG